jgi:TRAP-type C4-dicarboxylate transport system permease small subunit
MNLVFTVVKKLEDALCILGISALLGLVSMQVVGRFLPWSFPWTEELARYVFIWTVMIGISYATRAREHVALLLGDQVLGRRGVFVVHAASGFCSLAFFVAMAVLGANQTSLQFSGNNAAYSLELPLWTVWLSVPVGMLLSAIWTVRNIGHLFNVRNEA